MYCKVGWYSSLGSATTIIRCLKWNMGYGFKPCPHQTFAIMASESYQWLYWEFIPFEISVVD